MTERVYSVIELVGTSDDSWEKAAAAAIEQASKTLRDLRVARIVEQDIHIESGNQRRLLLWRLPTQEYGSVAKNVRNAAG